MDGVLAGAGIYLHSDGSRYEGYWKNNEKNGSGTMKFSNGDVFKGNFVNGRKVVEVCTSTLMGIDMMVNGKGIKKRGKGFSKCRLETSIMGNGTILIIILKVEWKKEWVRYLPVCQW